MKQLYDSRNTTMVDGVKKITESFEIVRKRVNILWADRCKQQEVLKKKDDYPEDQGNPDPSTTSEQPPTSTSTQLIVVHLITRELLEEGEIISDLSHEQLLALNAMKEIEDVEIDKMSSEPETADLDNVEEIVFEGNEKKSSYVREDGTEFAPFNEEWLKENVDVIDEHLKNRDTSENAPDVFSEWQKQFLSKVSKTFPADVHLDYLQFEKEKVQEKILCWMFVKEIHCVAIKREFGIQYFRSLLSILSLPFTMLQL
ncbi:hypothetical protein Hanom_Chr16g01432711 [Helianthus anomalus]